jgi:(1->4)-alpha-D-glucan 1-alpha-D-glucosylmutase
LWDFSLVDPDNRTPVDYDMRRALLTEFKAEMTAEEREAESVRLMTQPRDARLKLYATATLLRFRRAHHDLFQSGGYTALGAGGARRDHLFAFSRTLGNQHVVVAVPRLIATLLPDATMTPLGERVWADTSIAVPSTAPSSFRHLLSGQCIRVRRQGDTASIPAAEVFAHFPVAFLEGH